MSAMQRHEIPTHLNVPDRFALPSERMQPPPQPQQQPFVPPAQNFAERGNGQGMGDRQLCSAFVMVDDDHIDPRRLCRLMQHHRPPAPSQFTGSRQPREPGADDVNFTHGR